MPRVEIAGLAAAAAPILRPVNPTNLEAMSIREVARKCVNGASSPLGYRNLSCADKT